MRRLAFFVLLALFATTAISADQPAPDKDDAPVQRAARPSLTGMELFSWHVKGDEGWHFALLPAPGTDKLKAAEDVVAKENAIDGVAALKKKLAALALNEKVGWFNMLDKSTQPPEGVFFDFPPKDVMKELELYCSVMKIRLNIFQANTKK